jgi:hypothetical protein
MSERFSGNSFIFKSIAFVGTVSAYVGYYFISNSKNNTKHKFTDDSVNKSCIKKSYTNQKAGNKLNIHSNEMKELLEDANIENLIENQKSYDILLTHFENVMKELQLEIKTINNNKIVDIQNELKSIRNTIESNKVRIKKLEMNNPEISFFENKKNISILSNNRNLLSGTNN